MKELLAYEHGFTDPQDFDGMELDWVIDYLRGFDWEQEPCILADGRPKLKIWLHHPDGISILFKFSYDSTFNVDPVNCSRYVYSNPGKRWVEVPEQVIRR